MLMVEAHVLIPSSMDCRLGPEGYRICSGHTQTVRCDWRPTTSIAFWGSAPVEIFYSPRGGLISAIN